MTKKIAFTLLFLAGLLAGALLPGPAQAAEPPLTLERADEDAGERPAPAGG